MTLRHPEQPGYYEGANERILVRVPQDAKRILDVGCASGELGRVLKAQGPGIEVWGIELLPEVAAIAKQHLDHVLVGDIEQMTPLALPEGYFDCVVCGDILEHLREPASVLRILRPHMTPEATLICNVPNIAHWSVVLDLMRGQFQYADEGLLDRTHLRFFTPASLRSLLWDTGFVVLSQDALSINGEPLSNLVRLAATLGVKPSRAAASMSTYQHLIVARKIPDKSEDTARYAAILGPHIGKLGEASCRATVVILTYNSASTITACLESALATIDTDDEVIIVDNKSVDETVSLLSPFRSDPRVRVIVNEENLGFSAGCNVGALASKGEYVVFLNPDTVVHGNWLAGLISALHLPGVGAVGPVSDNVCGLQFIGNHKRRSHFETTRDSVLSPAGKHVFTKMLIGFCLALRRGTLNTWGLLDEQLYLGADDLELSWRLRVLGLTLSISLDSFVSHIGGRSFASLTAETKALLVAASDNALIGKMTAFYGGCELPSSEDIWGCNILSEALMTHTVDV